MQSSCIRSISPLPSSSSTQDQDSFQLRAQGDRRVHAPGQHHRDAQGLESKGRCSRPTPRPPSCVNLNRPFHLPEPQFPKTYGGTTPPASWEVCEEQKHQGTCSRWEGAQHGALGECTGFSVALPGAGRGQAQGRRPRGKRSLRLFPEPPPVREAEAAPCLMAAIVTASKRSYFRIRSC